MKKTIMTLAIVLGLSMASFAQGGMFQRGATPDGGNTREDPLMPGLPTHGLDDHQDAPVGSGIAILATLGAAYLIGKKRNEE